MRRDTLGGFPYDIKREKGFTIIRFYPKSPTAKYPNDAVQTLKLNENDRKKLLKIISDE